MAQGLGSTAIDIMARGNVSVQITSKGCCWGCALWTEGAVYISCFCDRNNGVTKSVAPRFYGISSSPSVTTWWGTGTGGRDQCTVWAFDNLLCLSAMTHSSIIREKKSSVPLPGGKAILKFLAKGRRLMWEWERPDEIAGFGMGNWAIWNKFCHLLGLSFLICKRRVASPRGNLIILRIKQ